MPSNTRRKERTAHFRITEAEDEELRLRAQRLGFPGVSAYLRALVFPVQDGPSHLDPPLRVGTPAHTETETSRITRG